MQLVEQRSETPRTVIEIGPSIAVEMSWALLAARKEQLCTNHPVLEALYQSPNGLEKRIRSFWADGVADFGELLVLADQARLVGSVHIEELLGGIAAAAVDSPAEMALLSESETDRLVFLARLDRLRRSPHLRRDYVQLLRDLWAEVGPAWEAEGHRRAAAAAERYRRRLERGSKWADLIVADCEYLSQLLPRLIRQLPAFVPVTIAPSYFSGQGLLFDLPNGIVVGVSAAETGQHARARTDVLAKRLKSLADPTRLAIIDALAAGPMTVGEIARSFDLAQPTVSNHVKILREAGVVVSSRRGSRVELEVRKDAGNELLEDVKALMGGAVGDDTQAV